MTTDLALGTRLNGYRIDAELGRGGMGVVYLAQQVGLDRKVAVKVIAPELSGAPAFRRRFEREARLAASLDHPNVVPVFEAGDINGVLFLAMRFVRGTDLAALLAEKGRLAPEHAASIALQLGAALDEAHGRGLIHRDVKPANVLLNGDDVDAHAYLTDFGLTKDSSAEATALTHPGQWVGTVDYVSPEQLEGGTIDARSDVYSLGCLLFEMLTGRVPFEGTKLERMWAHANQPPPALGGSELEALEPVVHRAMAKRPEDRYPSAGDLGRAALAAVRGEPVAVPERSVAAGAAAGEPVTVVERTDESPPPWPAATSAPPSPPPMPVAVPSAPPPRRGVGLGVALGALALLAVGAAVFFAVRASDSGTDSSAGPTQPAGKIAPDTPDDDSGKIGYRSFKPETKGYSAQIPTGDGWSAPVETEPSPGTLYRTTINGPGGMVLIIDYTPTQAASFGSGYTSTREVDQPAFGSATEYVFTGGHIPECANSKCVDYTINGGTSGPGFGVLVGGGTDFELAERVARKVMRSLT